MRIFKHALLAITAIFVNHTTLADQFTSTDLAESSLQNLTNCLEYKIEGITLRVIWTPYGPYYFWTPNVSHYSPDMLSMSHRELNDMPYTEFNRLFGTSVKGFANTAFAKGIGNAMGINLPETGGGRYEYGGWGEYQSGQFTESTVIGNPAAMLIDAFTWDGMRMTGKETRKITEVSGNEVNDYLKDFSEGNASWSPNFDDQLNFDQTMMVMANSPVVQSIKQLVRQIDSMVSSMRGKIGDSPFCPVDQTAFQPYYLSSVDSFMWRIGYPITDADKAAIVLNPLSTDEIKDGNELWGHLYPRDGAVNHQEAQKVAAVIALRSKDVLANGGQGRIYRKPDYDMKRVAWSKIHPKQTQCHIKITNTGTETDPKDNYAWTIWTRHQCDLFRIGAVVAFVPVGPITVTSEIPE